MSYHIEGTYDVLLTAYSFVILVGIKPWLHHTQVKLAPPQSDFRAAKDCELMTHHRLQISLLTLLLTQLFLISYFCHSFNNMITVFCYCFLNACICMKR